ncbi:MAG: hypothetical protein Q9O24_07765 [Gammaproteobacteria bacterium]|nr:hypothetical protein [Gammaproteobacteria bacterium]
MLNLSPPNPSTRCSHAPVEVVVYTVCVTSLSRSGGRTTRPVSRYFSSRIGAFTSFDPDPDYLAWYHDLLLLDSALAGGGL